MRTGQAQGHPPLPHAPRPLDELETVQAAALGPTNIGAPCLSPTSLRGDQSREEAQ